MFAHGAVDGEGVCGVHCGVRDCAQDEGGHGDGVGRGRLLANAFGECILLIEVKVGFALWTRIGLFLWDLGGPVVNTILMANVR